MSNPAETWSRGNLARHTGVKSETIRYYENCGLLATPPRSTGGHRIYCEEHARALFFIRRCRELGFAIAEIKGLMGLAAASEQNCDEIRQYTESHLSDVQGKIKDLRKMERTLKAMVGDCTNNTSPNCPIINTLLS